MYVDKPGEFIPGLVNLALKWILKALFVVKYSILIISMFNIHIGPGKKVSWDWYTVQ